MQREEPPVMTTQLERIAAQARFEPKLRSLDPIWLLRVGEDRGGAPPYQGEVTATATTPGPAKFGSSGICCAVNPSSKSVVREIRTLRSVGAGGGRLPPATRSSDIKRTWPVMGVCAKGRNRYRGD